MRTSRIYVFIMEIYYMIKGCKESIDMRNYYWLIDGSYMYKAAKAYQIKHSGFNLDYKKLRDKVESLLGKDVKITAYYYNSTPDPATDAQNAFHNWLKSASPTGPNIRVQLYSLKNVEVMCNYCGKKTIKFVQKGVDVGIVTAALKFHPRYDGIVLSTGDGDFEDTLKYLAEDLKKEIIIVGFRHGLSTDLQQYTDKVYFVDEFSDEINNSRYTMEPYNNADKLIEAE